MSLKSGRKGVSYKNVNWKTGKVRPIVPDATDSTKGLVQVGEGIEINNGIIYLEHPLLEIRSASVTLSTSATGTQKFYITLSDWYSKANTYVQATLICDSEDDYSKISLSGVGRTQMVIDPDPDKYNGIEAQLTQSALASAANVTATLIAFVYKK